MSETWTITLRVKLDPESPEDVQDWSDLKSQTRYVCKYSSSDVKWEIREFDNE